MVYIKQQRRQADDHMYIGRSVIRLAYGLTPPDAITLRIIRPPVDYREGAHQIVTSLLLKTIKYSGYACNTKTGQILRVSQ
jgi:hypothetical protein